MALLPTAVSECFVLLTIAGSLGLAVAFFHPNAPDVRSQQRSRQLFVTEEEMLQAPANWIVLRLEQGLEVSQQLRTIDLAPEAFEEQIGPLLDLWKPDLSVAITAPPGLETLAGSVAERLKNEAGISPVFLLKSTEEN
ncbi:MAG: hypothetical protein SNJ52_00420 [Verrucomicrobiia bacterium]